jgi:hypothetical protein
MGDREDYEKKLKVITAIADNQIKTPHHIPVSVYIQEANTLYHWCRADKEALTAVGLSGELIEDLPVRMGALIHAESSWYVQRNTWEAAAREWAKQSPPAYDLRDRLLKAFRFAFRRHPDLLKTVKFIAKGKTHASMIQGLNDLAVLGKNNPGLLEAIHFDGSLLDKAAQTADEMAPLLAAVNSNKARYSEAKKIRDQAYTHLKEAVDEIREYGKYVFRKNKERFTGYASNHIRTQNKKRRRKAGKQVPQVPKSDTTETGKS